MNMHIDSITLFFLKAREKKWSEIIVLNLSFLSQFSSTSTVGGLRNHGESEWPLQAIKSSVSLGSLLVVTKSIMAIIYLLSTYLVPP